jgi:thiamine kinase-like enzyme
MSARAIAERLWPGRVESLEVLGGGITNRNYKVAAGGETYVLRIGGAETEQLGIDRDVERDASLAAAELGIGPDVVAFVEPEGCLVTRFIEGEVGRVTIAEAAELLRRFHAGRPIAGRFDSFRVVEAYATTAVEYGLALPPAYADTLELARRIEARRGPVALRPCHDDLLAANFINDGERVWIVDWEYAGMGDRFFDLANLSVNHEFGVDEDRLLLAAYFGKDLPVDLAALRLMRFMSDFREAMWGVVQSGISELDFDFTGYAAEHFDRMSRAAAGSRFEDYLGLFG